MAVQDVVVVSVPVSDQERAKAFYVDKLGFELRREDDSVPGIRWVQWPPGGTTALTLVTWFESIPPGSLNGARAQVEQPPDRLLPDRLPATAHPLFFSGK
ncbi:MAG TPA: VOC family protein [Actinomycetes bacterium]|jgi:catechol 2,3-dioxygenase-like lactoylglutathione lyase family enzyme|nr:VOC family protein [Actinomycetes bacterium]